MLSISEEFCVHIAGLVCLFYITYKLDQNSFIQKLVIQQLPLYEALVNDQRKTIKITILFYLI